MALSAVGFRVISVSLLWRLLHGTNPIYNLVNVEVVLCASSYMGKIVYILSVQMNMHVDRLFKLTFDLSKLK